MDIVKSCQLHFSFDMPSILWAKRASASDFNVLQSYCTKSCALFMNICLLS